MNLNTWNSIAAAAPLAGLAFGLFTTVTGVPQGSGAEGGIGALFRGALILAGFCAAGELSAIAAIANRESPRWLGFAMAAVNLLLLLPGAWVAIRMDWS